MIIPKLEIMDVGYWFRQVRNEKLNQTDWWVLLDRTPTKAQLDYRQALRDLPANSTPSLDQNGQLINVNWPEIPQ